MKCKWCQNVQDTSALVTKCLGFLRWCRSVYWTFRHQCRNVLGPKCLRSEVSVHQTQYCILSHLGVTGRLV